MRVNEDGTVASTVNFTVRRAGTINSIVPLAAGQWLVTGRFASIRGTAVPSSVARLNADGSIDSAFNVGGTGSDNDVYAAVAQPDGKVYIGGQPIRYNGSSRSQVLRLNSDGSVDTSFNSVIDAGAVYNLLLLSGGRIFLGGALFQVGGVPRPWVVVLTATGSVDASFDAGTGPNNSVYASALQSDGQILIGGAFNAYGGSATGGLARLAPNGTLDTAFNSGGAGAVGTVHAISLQADGRILIGGTFNSYNGTVRTGVARLTSDGKLDATFVPPSVGLVYSLLMQEDGKVLVRGSFPGVGGAAGTSFLARLNVNGSLDTTFGAGGFAASTLNPSALAMSDNGQLLMQSNGAPGLSATIAAAPPAVSTPPASKTVALGGSLTLTAAAASALSQTYQWYRGTTALAGATNATLTITGAQAADAGSYTVVVTNELGSTTSAVATLAVVDPARSLLTGSVRASVGTGAAVLNGVFTVEGPTAKQMLVRGVGPALGSFGVSGVLADPRLVVVNATTGATVATNDDWGAAGNAAQVPSASAQVGAFALAAGSKDAAVLANFAPGTYRVTLSGAAGSTGTALLEIYDADSTPRLVYLATRARVGPGAEALIKGVTIAAPVAGRSYLVRALGPSLHVPGALADPQVSVLAGANVAATNNDWAGDTAVAALAASVGAMPLPAASKDAALVFTPALPGSFTVQVSGAGGSTGLALVEVFEADATRAATIAPAVVSGPEPLAVAAGQPATLGVVALGKPAPTYQWRKNSVAIVGATSGALALNPALPGDSGTYDVVVANSAGSATSPAAVLAVSSPHAHALVGSGFVAGSTATITNTLTYSGAPTGLAWSATLPAGWTLASDTATTAGTRPSVGAGGTLAWDWTTPPPSPVTFAYTVNIPTFENADRSIAAVATVRAAGGNTALAAGPDPLPLPRIVFHSADIDRDYRLSLTELLRVIALFNHRAGNVRTGQYSRMDGSEDGFVGGSGGAPLAVFHSADTRGGTSPGGPDGRIDLVELTRVIELYNYRAGTVRTGQYRAKSGTEDGFAPGP